jgi:hypothetical protein
MPSTIPRNWMIGHHIISTISGHDHRPARRSAAPAPGDDVAPEQEGSFFAAGVVR